MGIVFFPFSKNDEVLVRNQAYEKHFWDNCIIISHKRACFADLLAEVFEKKVFSGKGSLSRSAICPSDMFHAATAAFRADMDIYVPNFFQKFCNG